MLPMSELTSCGHCVPGFRETYSDGKYCPVHGPTVDRHCSVVEKCVGSLLLIIDGIGSSPAGVRDLLREAIERIRNLIRDPIFTCECDHSRCVKVITDRIDVADNVEVRKRIKVVTNLLCSLHPAAINEMQQGLIQAIGYALHVLG